MYEPAPANPIGTFSERKLPKGTPNPVCGPRTVHYPSDGSGRDCYVGTTSGGMHASYRDHEYRDAFKRSLR